MIAKSIRSAWSVYRKHWLFLMRLTLGQLLLGLLCLTPLLGLASAATKPLALLYPVLVIALFFPVRMNSAKLLASLSESGEKKLPLTTLLDFSAYGAKVLLGLKQTLCLLLWSLPVLLTAGYAFLLYKGKMLVLAQGALTLQDVDVFTLLRIIMNLGKSAPAQMLLGSLNSVTLQGVMTAVLIFLLSLLPLVVGLGVHSWRRHGYALQVSRKAMKGHRGSSLGLWLLGLLTLLPFCIVTGVVSMSFVKALMGALSNLSKGSLTLPPLNNNLYLIAAAFVVLCLPLLPFKSLLTARHTALSTAKEEQA